VKCGLGIKYLILKLSKVLSVEEVRGPYIHPNQRLIHIQKWYDTCDIQLTFAVLLFIRPIKSIAVSVPWP